MNSDAYKIIHEMTKNYKKAKRYENRKKQKKNIIKT